MDEVHRLLGRGSSGPCQLLDRLLRVLSLGTPDIGQDGRKRTKQCPDRMHGLACSAICAAAVSTDHAALYGAFHGERIEHVGHRADPSVERDRFAFMAFGYPCPSHRSWLSERR